jgi:CDP-diacylglycerol---serine O-phosphatidyltransferase
MKEYVKLPNLLTSGSLAAGFLAMVLIFQDNLLPIFQNNLLGAAGLVALAAVLDILDGPVARRVGTEGTFGTNLDSLADLVSFGAAPALALYWGSLYELPVVGITVCLVFLVCGAWRLARFSICKNPLYFVGCPIPAAGLLVALLAVLRPHPLLALPVALALSVLMVSTHPFPTLSGLRNREELSEVVEEYRQTR